MGAISPFSLLPHRFGERERRRAPVRLSLSFSNEHPLLRERKEKRTTSAPRPVGRGEKGTHVQLLLRLLHEVIRLVRVIGHLPESTTTTTTAEVVGLLGEEGVVNGVWVWTLLFCLNFFLYFFLSSSRHAISCFLCVLLGGKILVATSWKIFVCILSVDCEWSTDVFDTDVFFASGRERSSHHKKIKLPRAIGSNVVQYKYPVLCSTFGAAEWKRSRA